MNFRSIHSLRTKLELNRQEIIILTTFFLAIGILSAIKPFYTLIIFIGLILVTIGALNPTKAFLGMGIFLIFQIAIVRNMTNLGSPIEIINIVKRIDEFIWVLFIGYIIIHNYNGKTWKLKKTNIDTFAIIFAGLGIISAFVNQNSLFWSSIAIFLILKGYIIFWLSMNMNIDKEKVILFFKILIFILVFTAFIGILQFSGISFGMFVESERLGLRVAHSIFAHHGVFGTLMAVGIALAIGLKLGTGSNRWSIIATILLIGLIASSVRRSIIGLLLGLLFVFINYKKFKIQKRHIYGYIHHTLDSLCGSHIYAC